MQPFYICRFVLAWLPFRTSWRRSDTAVHGDLAFEGVGLRPLDFWDDVFESRWRYGCSSFVPTVCCVDSGLCNGLITHSEDSYRVCVCLIVCYLESSTIGRSGPNFDCCARRRRRRRTIKCFLTMQKVKVNQSHYRSEVPRVFHEVKVPSLRDNGLGWW